MIQRQCFISYARRDQKDCNRIVVHLTAIGSSYGFTVWADHELRAGSKWSQRLASEIDKSSIFVLLVTNDFIASDYIREDELPAIASKRENENALVVPIILRESGWQPLCGRYIEAVPKNQHLRIVPCYNWSDREKAFATSATQIGAAVAEWFDISPKSPFAGVSA